MLQFIVWRFVQSIITVLGISAVVFYFTFVIGDPVVAQLAGRYDLDFDAVERIKKDMGFDQPIPVQYAKFVVNAAQGKIGLSLVDKRPVTEQVARRLPATTYLALAAGTFTLIVAIPLGMLAALKRGTFIDRIARTLAFSGQSIPDFFLALLLIYLFGVWLQWLPIAGKGSWQNLIMPAVAAGWFSMAGLLRITRSSMLEVLSSDYVRTARAKGLKGSTVLWVHSFRNALIPIVTSVALLAAGMLTGITLVEVIFAWPGVGEYAVSAALGQDVFAIQAVVLFTAALFVTANFLADVAYAVVDPRIRLY